MLRFERSAALLFLQIVREVDVRHAAITEGRVASQTRDILAPIARAL
jgi:acetolactate synthase regulatory subunit